MTYLKEVLALCVRLAVAKHLSERDPQCLVLDDPFVHDSSDRSNRMIELANEAIKECGLTKDRNHLVVAKAPRCIRKE